MNPLPDNVQAALAEQNWTEAEQLALATLDFQREDAAIWALLAVFSAQRSDIAEALSRNKSALLFGPDVAGTWLNQGNLEKLDGRRGDAKQSYEKALELSPNLSDAGFNLGVLAEEQDDLSSAETCYRETLARNPLHAGSLYNLARIVALEEKADATASDEAIELYTRAVQENQLWPDAWRNLANLLRKLGRDEEAIHAYEQLQRLDQADKSIPHLLSALRREKLAAPDTEYVSQLFDRFADTYDEELQEGLNYAGAKRLAELVRSELNKRPESKDRSESKDRPEIGKESRLDILDLGCGTGLFLEALQLSRVRAVGVDLSAAMIEKAKARGGYNHLEVGDLIQFLSECGGSFHIIAAADVFSYLGDLQPVFDQASQHLRSEGLFAFTVESWADGAEGDTFELQKNGRYRHTRPYIQSLAKEKGLSIANWESGALRQEKGSDVLGEFVVLQLKGT